MDVTTLAIAAVGLVIGLVAGFLLTRTLSPHEKKRRELETKLQAREDELKIYQRDVSDHLLKTSELLQELNRSQREIGEQLATSAARLSSPEVSRQVQEAAYAGLETGARPRILPSSQEPPKDYAPSVPGGILSEDYGLKDIGDSVTIEGLDIATDLSSPKDLEDEIDPTQKIS